MSRHWDAYCLNCQVGSGMRVQNGADLVSRVILHAQALAMLSDEFGVTTTICGSDRVNLTWFKTHSTHRLVVRSEYGEILGSCSQPVECSQCHGMPLCCVLLSSHSGEHDHDPSKVTQATPAQ